MGNVIGVYNLETGLEKKLYWNAWNQLILVEEGDLVWTAVYDALGRRLLVRSEAEGQKSEIKSYFDPEVEFLEIGVEVKGRKIWKLYGPDINGEYGGLNGVGGLEALIDETSSQRLYLINDLFGHIVGYIQHNKVFWQEEKIDPYGNVEWEYLEKAEKVKEEDILHTVAKSIYWRSSRCDITGLVNMGARYYHPANRRFVSPDPYGHTGSLDLYNYAGGDPVNYFDPDGRLLMASAGKVRDFSVKHGRVALDGLQFGLDVAGMVPVLGAVPDMVNAGIHTARGQYVAAGLSAAAAVPIVGDVVGGAKLAKNAYQGVQDASKLLKEAHVSRAYRKEIIESFERKTISVKKSSASNYGIRYYDNKKALERGHYLFETFPQQLERVSQLNLIGTNSMK